MSRAKIAVIGAGVNGLSCAVNIIENIPNAEVTVLADKFSPHTTGDVAAGVFGPRPLSFGHTDVSLQRSWFESSLKHFESLLRTEYAGIIGLEYLTGYFLSHDPSKDMNKALPWADLVYNAHLLSKKELDLFPGYKSGICFTTIVCDCRKYLPWLMDRFKRNGGKVVEKKVERMGELNGHYDVIVNCTGIGAKQLVGDTSMQPGRGQAIRVSAPWIKNFILTDTHPETYILPGPYDVYLGGTFQVGNWNVEVDKIDKQTIQEKCFQVVPSLKHAKFLHDWVGLRPVRPTVRLEKEIMNVGNAKLKVVHNYGHGAKGVAYSWGCSQQATRLVKEILSDSTQHSKL
ncbi:D-aspartate oxidase-like [Ptychodera flava]|uniref:D-aspartate oxidase-like n=1 Tax=Ptychodera flava TaxID=63121 RepID=UPI00396A288B